MTFQTKPQIAAALVARSTARFDWITADEEFGRDGGFLDALEKRNQRYLLEVPANTTVWLDEADAARPPTSSSGRCVCWPQALPAKAGG